MTQDFSTLAKANSNTKMTEAWKNLTTKNQVENVLDLGEKKIRMSYLLVCYFHDDRSHNYLTFQSVSINFQVFTGTINTFYGW